MLAFTSFIAVGALLSSSLPQASASSFKVVNSCTDTIWAHEVYGKFTKVFPVAPKATATMNQPPDNTGVAVNVYTGCSDDTATSCKTGGVNNNGGASPFIRAEATFTGSTVNYDISPLYGYNNAMKITTGDAKCPAVQCAIDVSDCPVKGPDGTCFAPCCDSADNCQGTNSCPYDSNPAYNKANGGKGKNSDWYNSVCPNAYSFPDDDCANYHHSPDASCPGNTDVTVTVCPEGGSSKISLC